MLYSKQEWFKTQQEMNDIFSDVPEALANTVEILDKVETYCLDADPIMPFFPIPESFGTEEEWRKKFTEQQLFEEFTSDENGQNPLPQEDAEKKIKKLGGYDKIYRIKFEADYLAKLAYEGAKRRYGDPIPKDVEERVKFELHIMKTMGFPGYFLIVQDFINSARTNLE
jgi:DNA polymerase-3 subunit alpha